MKIFRCNDLDEAKAHAAAGGQALHLHQIVFPDSPWCFRRAVERGEYIAHLLDQDGVRLCATARRLGVNLIVVDRPGQAGQHVDLCGKPLRIALRECGAEERIVARKEGVS